MGSICTMTPITTHETSQTKTITRQVSLFSKNRDFRHKYEFLNILGKGAFGIVRWYRDKQLKGMQYAIKTLSKKGITNSHYQKLIGEIKILSHLDHPNIVKYYETYEDDCYVHIVMEYLKGDNLFKLITSQELGEIQEKNICVIISQLLKAVSFIHSKNIMHCDIKPENIWFNNSEDYYSLKLIDFGLATMEMNNGKEAVGSPYYMSPEILQGNKSIKTDIWSVGVILHWMLTGKFPYDDESSKFIIHKIISNDLDTSVIDRANCSDEAKDWVKHLLEKNVSKRMNSVEALAHKWFKKFETKKSDSSKISEDTINTLREFTKKSALQKELLFLIARVIDENEIPRLRDCFNQLDITNTGTLKVNEIRQGLKSWGHDIREEDLKSIWDGLDFHKDGEVNYTEFLAAMISNLDFLKEENWWSAFQYFENQSDDKTRDDNEGRFISVESLFKATNAFGFEINEEEIKKGFDNWSNNGKVLNFEEFKKLLNKQ